AAARTAVRSNVGARGPQGRSGRTGGAGAGPRPGARRIRSRARHRRRPARVIMDVVIAIPAYDEATTVAGVVAAARLHAPVLVVDDGSTDDTALRAAAAGAEVVRHDARRGKGAALATAFTAARAKGATFAVTLDADGQHDSG